MMVRRLRTGLFLAAAAALCLIGGSLAAEVPAQQAAVSPPTHRELSTWSMFLAADPLVKAVMTLLAAASVAAWTVLFAKTFELRLLRRKLVASLDRLRAAPSLDQASESLPASLRPDVMARLIAATLREIELSDGIAASNGIRQRAASRCAEIVRMEGNRIRSGMGLLATIGATSPFIGLFGTVWGIMNSFIGISKSQTTSLAVVAPGIAEALLATAFGLAAAIPAVIIYNHLTRAGKAYLELLVRASGEVSRLLSRALDRRDASTAAPAPAEPHPMLPPLSVLHARRYPDDGKATPAALSNRFHDATEQRAG